MLLEFGTRNFKSFRDGFVLSMEPSPYCEGLDYSVIRRETTNGLVEALPTGVLYGPNGSGKSNVIMAMHVFQDIVKAGGISRLRDSAGNQADKATILDVMPYRYLANPEPVTFFVDLVLDGERITYGFSVECGSFLGNGQEKQIVEEWLSLGEEDVYRRRTHDGDDEIVLSPGDPTWFKEYGNTEFQTDPEAATRFAQASLESDKLFLCNGFRGIISRRLYEMIYSWVVDRLAVVTNALQVQFNPEILESSEQKTVLKALNSAAKIFGSNADAVSFAAREQEKPYLVSYFKSLAQGANVAIDAEAFESYGTIRLLNMIPLILAILKCGGVLVVDELDASLHPWALMSIVNLFHNDEVNTKGAQLILSAHNPMLMDPNILRGDEIKFVEKPDDRFSQLYSLADFEVPEGDSNENWMRNYFQEKYGAISMIDFTDLVSEVVNEDA